MGKRRPYAGTLLLGGPSTGSLGAAGVRPHREPAGRRHEGALTVRAAHRGGNDSAGAASPPDIEKA